MKNYHSNSFVALFLALSLFANSTYAAGKDDATSPQNSMALLAILSFVQTVTRLLPLPLLSDPPSNGVGPVAVVPARRARAIQLVLPGDNPHVRIVIRVTPELFADLQENIGIPEIHAELPAEGDPRIVLPAGLNQESFATVMDLIAKLARLERERGEEDLATRMRFRNEFLMSEMAKLTFEQISNLLKCIDTLQVERLLKPALLVLVKQHLNILFAKDPQRAVQYLLYLRATAPKIAKSLLTYIEFALKDLSVDHMLLVIGLLEQNMKSYGAEFHDQLLQIAVTVFTERHVIPHALKNPALARALLRRLDRPDSLWLLHIAFGIIRTTDFQDSSEKERSNIAEIIYFIGQTAKRSNVATRSSLPGKILGAIQHVAGEAWRPIAATLPATPVSAFSPVTPRQEEHPGTSQATLVTPITRLRLSSIVPRPGSHALRDPTIAPTGTSGSPSQQTQTPTSELGKDELAKKISEFKERLKKLKAQIEAALTKSNDSVIAMLQESLRSVQKEIAASQERVATQRISSEIVAELLYELQSWETNVQSLLRKMITHEQTRMASIATDEEFPSFAPAGRGAPSRRGSLSSGRGTPGRRSSSRASTDSDRSSPATPRGMVRRIDTESASPSPTNGVSSLLSALGQVISTAPSKSMSPRTVLTLSDMEGTGIRMMDPTQGGFVRDGILRSSVMSRGFSADGAHQLKSSADDTFFNEDRTMILSRDRDEHAGEGTYKLFVKVGSEWVYRDTVALITINDKVYIRRLDRNKKLSKARPGFIFLMDSSGNWYVVGKEGKDEVVGIGAVKEK